MKWGFIARNDLDGVEADSQFAKQHDFLGLEFNYWGNFAELQVGTVKAMRRIMDTHGVGACALGLWGWNHLSADDDERQQAHDMLNRGLDYAEILGADVLITGGGQMQDASVEENASEFIQVFPPFLQRAQDAGITMALYAVHGNSFFVSIEAYERVWQELEGVTIKFDPANWCHHGDDYLSILRDHADKIGHVHIKEHLYMADDLASQPPAGMGDIQWGKVLAFLHEHNYTGYLSIEPHGPIWSRDPFREKMLLLSKTYIDQFLI